MKRRKFRQFFHAWECLIFQHLQFQLSQILAKHKAEELIIFNEVSYKPGTVIIEESQQLALAVAVAQAGRKVLVREKPLVIELLKEKYGNLFAYEVLS